MTSETTVTLINGSGGTFSGNGTHSTSLLGVLHSRAAAKGFDGNRSVSGTVMANYTCGVDADRINMVVIDKVGTITASYGSKSATDFPLTFDGGRARRLTPLECERLQGFPDNYTAGFSNSQRYRMLGNSMAVPVIRWIGKRILEQEGE